MLDFQDIEIGSDEYESVQEFNKATELLNKEYLTKREYDLVVKVYPEEESNMNFLGDESNYGDYLNLNVYTEHEEGNIQHEYEIDLINWELEQNWK